MPSTLLTTDQVWETSFTGAHIIEAIGGGGAGGPNTSPSASSGGGGGGGYASVTINLTAGDDLDITIGVAGQAGSNDGGTTIVEKIVGAVVVAQAEGGLNGGIGSGGNGGSGSVGDFTSTGGNGGGGGGGSENPWGGGGGGGAGSGNGNGLDGDDGTSTDGGDGGFSDEGDGGPGGDPGSGNGTVGVNYGGGGGGGAFDGGFGGGSAGAGAPGAVRITWDIATDEEVNLSTDSVQAEYFPLEIDNFGFTPQSIPEPYARAELQYDVTLNLTPQALEESLARASYGIDQNVELSIQSAPEPESHSLTANIEIQLSPSPQEAPTWYARNGTIEFSVDLSPATIPEWESRSPTIVSDTNLNPSPAIAAFEFFPLEIQYGTELQLTPQSALEPYAFLVHPYIFLPSNAKYTEVLRSSNVVYGTEPGPFKLSHTGFARRRIGRTQPVHLTTVRPDFIETYVEFELLTPTAELSIDEFNYTAPGGWLEIWNDVIIQPNLIPDGDSTAIPITIQEVRDVYGIATLHTFDSPRLEELPVPLPEPEPPFGL